MAKTLRDGRKRLTRFLNKADESKTQIAKRLKMTIEQLRHIEAGRRKPTLPQAIAFEDAGIAPVRAWL